MSLTYRVFVSAILLLTPFISIAQQFVGLSTRAFSSIQQMPTNPAWVAASNDGMEVMLFSVSGLAGTNAFSFKKDFIFQGFNSAAREDQEYVRSLTKQKKHLWANIDFYGPAISFKYKDIHHIGVFTRGRQIVRAGNVTDRAFSVLGQATPSELYGENIDFRNAGFSTHSFTEIGFTYGRVLKNDYYNVMRGGVSVKFLMGFVGGSLYTNDMTYSQNRPDTLGSLEGDLNLLYSYNIRPFIDRNGQNDLSSWAKRGGKWGLGLDIGWQYEYHPDGNPNVATPYLYSLYASLTDLGSIGYVADRGSGAYELNLSQLDTAQIKKHDWEEIYQYMERMEKDSLIDAPSSVEKFRIGLPTALRFGGDYNMSEKVNIAANVLLNLRGNGGDVYKPAYVNYFNITPTYGGKVFQFSLPFTLIGYQSLTMGTIIRFGPFYVGSSSLVTSLVSRRMRNIDAYAGFVWKFRKEINGYF